MVPSAAASPRPNQAGREYEPAATALRSLEEHWALSDALFRAHVPGSAATHSPIHLRNPYIFYMGHLPSFASTRLLAPLAAAPRPDLDTLFLRGRDPDVDGPDPGLLEKPWPRLQELQAYRDDVRAAVRAATAAGRASPRVLRVVSEHEAMHIETLYYMLAQHAKADYVRARAALPPRDTNKTATPASPTARPAVDWLPVPAGRVRLGRDLSDAAAPFGWDNEAIGGGSVEAFRMARHAVSVSDLARFVAAGGYAEPRWWAPSDWDWVRREGLRCPAGWVLDEAGNVERVCNKVGPGADSGADSGARPDERALDGWRDWPASTSLAEARAYARWMGARLPTEAEWVRAACASGDVDQPSENGQEEEDAWSRAHVQAAGPCSVRTGPASWCGVVAMVGNGWELTESVLARFDGFVEMGEYPEYTADFFDDKHFVAKGASWATPRAVVRRSFRNYYQARYPFVFSKIRLVAT